MCSGGPAPTARRCGGGLGALLLAAALALPGGAGARPLGDQPSAAPEAVPPPAPADRDTARTAIGVDGICDLIERAAGAHALPPAFFARLIWKESRFDVAAVSPVGAQGIAQFMPGTAKLEGLSDPFDPHLAIPASAKHLADLRGEFGNLGLAAAAYNSGRNRVARWLAGASGLPWETLDYVQSITARPADWFRDSGREVEDRPLDETLSFGAGCRKLPIMKTRAVFAGASVPPWGAQVAGGISHAAAHQAFARARRANPGLIGGEPLILRNRRGAGPRFSARIGHPDRGAALAFCRRLTARGSPCTVQRN